MPSSKFETKTKQDEEVNIMWRLNFLEISRPCQCQHRVCMKRGDIQGLREDLMGVHVYDFEDLVMSGSKKRCDPTFLARKLSIIQSRDSATISPSILEHRLKNTVPF
jgi:hypothetical protein